MPEEFDAQDGLTPSELAASRDPFAYCRPSEGRRIALQALRGEFKLLRDYINETVANCRFRALALTELEAACHWAIKACVFTDPDATIEE